ncbi:glycosyltransferase family 39 protein [Streptomyces sp. TRM70350]|uniref:glycosyltransferase family 39 protein n=1 Tax=Streptomyces sp. TRM70350 TaxID=2856165 RepID=UPI001C471EF7|nr:glycosyltransferase family 39 protein [Streptomyces sp. TRM70350]MBV7698973.1 glycosyltransferase family 39 protein [Streptomyces sp. TRM70350]
MNGQPETKGISQVGVAVVAMPAFVMLGIGLWGLDRGGMWRDEAVTFQVARRSLPEIWRLLHSVDAVHGLYYLLMHPLLVLRADEVVLRLPSVCAAAVTAGLVAALGSRLARPRVGLWAGLLYAVTPMAGHYAQEGRSYALVAACAAGATLLLVRAVAGAAWWPYGLAVAVTCLLHELAVLLLLAHALTLAHARVPRAVWGRWGRAAGAAVLALVPLVVVSCTQAGQVAWLPVPRMGSVERLLRSFTGWETEVFWAYVVLIAVALWPGRGRGTPPGRRPSLVGVALPLVTVPPLTLIAVSQIKPMYDDRYVLYALAGAPLLAAAGADRLVRGVGRSPLATVTGVLAVGLAFAHQFPLHRQDRTPFVRADNLATVSADAARELSPGDPVLFLPAIGRRAALAYPEAFRGVWDVALGVPAPESGTLYGQEVDAAELRRRLAGLDRLWVVAEPHAWRARRSPRESAERVKLGVVREQFVPYGPRREHVREGATLRLYVRRAGAADTTALMASVPDATRSKLDPAGGSVPTTGTPGLTGTPQSSLPPPPPPAPPRRAPS